MAQEELKNNIIQQLKVFSMAQLATVAHEKHEIGSSIQSAKAILSRHIKPMVEMGELKKTGAVYHLPHLKGTGEHAMKTTDVAVELLRHWSDVTLFRERRIHEVSMQPDLMAHIKDGERSCILIVETMINETENYFQSKRSTWEGWAGATEFLTELFGVKVPYFHLCTYGKSVTNVLTLADAIEKMLEN